MSLMTRASIDELIAESHGNAAANAQRVRAFDARHRRNDRCGHFCNYWNSSRPTLGELLAWFIAWDLIFDYALRAPTIEIGWSGNFLGISKT